MEWWRGVIAKVATWRRRLRRPEIKGRSNWPAQAQTPRLQAIQHYFGNFRDYTHYRPTRFDRVQILAGEQSVGGRVHAAANEAWLAEARISIRLFHYAVRLIICIFFF